jgi:hypothetical protein
LDTFISPTWVTKDVALNFDNELALLAEFDRSWDDSFVNKPQGAKIGDTVQVRTQQRFTVSDGQALQQQAILNQTVPITINHQYHVDMGWSSSQARLDVEEVQDRYTVPAGQSLASKWDAQAGLEVYKSVYNSVGTPGTPITTNSTYTQAQALLRSLAVPADFCAVLDPQSQADISGANFALFNPQGKVSEWVRNAQFGSRVLGINDWYVDPLMPVHTTGTFTASTPVTSSGSQTGSSLAISGMGTYALKKGDVFTVAGVYSVNPVAYTTTRYLQQFTLTADVSGSSTATLSISPSIITSGQLQTVNAAPANGAALSFIGATGTVGATMAAQTSTQNLIFNPAAFAFVMVDLPENLPGADAKRYNNKKAAISIRWSSQWNIQTDQLPSRMDTIGGIAPILPGYAVRAWS